ncbi:hypothetical protein FNF31_05879 [Cafeteria roenbergensis]|uniref:Phospholipase A2 domain-containing protein n=2 Tax=Cafeteria roenbergensis TaxID=33653 RepID=A0A5A8CTY7_CAFRO|nr:hypothetical protein FNF31_05879 [Cafeteria roenbergensis]
MLGVCTEAISPSDLLKGMDSGMEAPACKIACADGTSPTETKDVYNPDHRGCEGRMFGRTNTGNSLGLGKCCDAHDACYHSCASGFQKCEEDFTTCLRESCESTFEPGSQKDTECRKAAAAMTMGTRMSGCRHYQYAQSTVCDCSQHGGPAKPERAERRRRTKSAKARRRSRKGKAKRDEL